MPSENVRPSIHVDSDGAAPDRRSRKRLARRDHLLDLAADLVDAHGVAGLTMAALAEAADYAPASLYTYFPSRSALVAALQERALVALGEVGDRAAAAWDRELGEGGAAELTSPQRALARLCAFSDLFLAAPVRHRREFQLQQQLLVTPGLEDPEDATALVPVAMHVLGLPQRLLSDAVAIGALGDEPGPVDPLGGAIDLALARTLAWVVALNGALMADGLTTGLPTTGTALGTQLTDALLVGWGAPPADLAIARAASAPWVDRTPDPRGAAS